MWNVKTKVIPVIIGATGTISKSFRIIIIIIIYLTANGLSPDGSGYNACT